MRITIRQPAGEDAAYAPDAWVSQVGKTGPFKVPGGREAMGMLVEAVVDEVGRSVELTFEVQTGALAWQEWAP